MKLVYSFEMEILEPILETRIGGYGNLEGSCLRRVWIWKTCGWFRGIWNLGWKTSG
jgi:hypothetical protein